MAEGGTGAPQPYDNLVELGSTGLSRSGGIIAEEFLTDLRGTRGEKVFREMSENDPIIGGITRGFEEVLGRLDWRIEAGDDATPGDHEVARFVQSCLEDMSETWDVTLSNIMSMCAYGYSVHEVVYKRRDGATGEHPSKHSDGRLGWRKWPVRAQATLSKWVFDDAGGVKGVIQNDSNLPAVEGMGNGERFLPIQKALLFRTRETKGNPEGMSLFRQAYVPWYYKKRIQEIEAVGVERDLAGLPMGYAPAAWFSSNATSDEKASLSALRDIVTKTKRNELEGIILPKIMDEKGNDLVDFKLLSGGGGRAFSTDTIITRYNNQIATSVLADYITLGHEKVGSYSLGTAKIDLWLMVVESLAKSIAEVVNRHAIPKLIRLNGLSVTAMPRLVFGTVAQTDLGVLGNFLRQMFDIGLLTPDDRLEEYIRGLADLPDIDLRTAGI